MKQRLGALSLLFAVLLGWLLLAPASGQQGPGSLISTLVGGGAKTQITDATNRINVMNGTTGAAAGGNALLTSGSAIQMPFSVSASGLVSSTLLNTAPGMIKSVSVQFSSVGTGSTVQILQTSNAWATSTLVQTFSGTGANGNALQPQTFSPSTTLYVVGATYGSGFELNVAVYGSGTITGVVTYYTTPSLPTALPFNQVTLSAGSASSTPGIGTIYQNAALSNTPVQVKSSSGNVCTLRIYNPNGSGTVCVELFAGPPTLGTTVPFDHWTMGVSSLPFESSFTIPSTLSGSIYIVCVTAYNGSSAPSTGVDISLRYN